MKRKIGNGKKMEGPMDGKQDRRRKKTLMEEQMGDRKKME